MIVIHILVSGTITVEALAAGIGNSRIHVVFKHYAPFTDCINEVNNIQIDGAKNINVVMPMFNLIEYNDNCSIISLSLWQYYRDGPALNYNDFLINVPRNSATFKFKQKITGSTGNDGTKAVNIMVALKYLSDF